MRKSGSKTLFNIKSSLKIAETNQNNLTSGVKNTNVVVNKTYPLIDTFSNFDAKNTLHDQPGNEEFDGEEIDLEEYLRADSLKSVLLG